jgi:hypothetical protein
MIEPGTPLELETPSDVRSAVVASLPFVDPNKEIPTS